MHKHHAITWNKYTLLSNLQYMLHQIPKLKCFSSHLAVIFAQSIEAMCYIENEDVVWAVLTGDDPTKSEWSSILLPIKGVACIKRFDGKSLKHTLSPALHELTWYIKRSGPIFCLLPRVSSGCARPVRGKVTSVTCPVIGWAQIELVPCRRHKTGPELGQYQPDAGSIGLIPARFLYIMASL